jgi:hypothetical protein
VDKRLEHRHHRILVPAQHGHRADAGGAKVAVDRADLHGAREHARESERDLLRILLAVHRDLRRVGGGRGRVGLVE